MGSKSVGREAFVSFGSGTPELWTGSHPGGELAERIFRELVEARAPLTALQLGNAFRLPREALYQALGELLDARRVATDPATLAYRVRSEAGYCPGCGEGPCTGERLLICGCGWSAPGFELLPDDVDEPEVVA